MRKAPRSEATHLRAIQSSLLPSQSQGCWPSRGPHARFVLPFSNWLFSHFTVVSSVELILETPEFPFPFNVSEVVQDRIFQ